MKDQLVCWVLCKHNVIHTRCIFMVCGTLGVPGERLGQVQVTQAGQ